MAGILPWMRQDTDEKFATTILLAFAHYYKHGSTREFKYEETLSVFDAPTLQTLRKLSLLRNEVLGLDSRKAGVDLVAKEARLEQYIASIDSYIAKVFLQMATTEKQRVVFEYNSPLSQSQLNAMYAVSVPEAEQLMALIVYAEVLRRQAFRKLAALIQPPSDWDEVCPEGPDMVHGAAARVLRRVAGVYAEAAKRAAAVAEKMPREMPAEFQPAMLSALEQAALAEAQGVMADRAEKKQTSPALLAGLYRASSDLFEAAAAMLRKNSSSFTNGISPLLKRYLALSSSLQEARARRCAALAEQKDTHSGKALALLRSAEELLSKALVVAEKESHWVEVLQQEINKIKELAAAVDRERKLITFEPIPSTPPPLPEAKVIVTPVEWAPVAQADIVFY